ncbi:fimbria/pilus periplasmic chaperone [Pantoea ananatis]|nr:fimbria/pilus periplasmic chaperone [Pantoea ananatis]MDI6535746.1 fimbria/pilus periplasmic chaperone [Pantoea ananatis]
MENRWLVFALKLFFITFLFLLAVNNARANVTILGSRVIYPASAKTVDVQLKNNGDIPYVIQAWFDNGDANSQPEQSSQTPFIVTPPVFRIQPRRAKLHELYSTVACLSLRIGSLSFGLTHCRSPLRI